MSNISNRHSIGLFQSGVSKALSGQRLCKIQYKSTKKQAAKYKNHCVSIPPLTEQLQDPSVLVTFASFIQSKFEDVQDSLIKSLFEGKDGKLETVSDDEIGLQAIAQYLASLELDNKLTKESLEQWFNETVSDNLAVLLCEKLGHENLEAPNVLVTLKHNKEILQLLAQDYNLGEKQLKACKSMLNWSSDSDSHTGKLIQKRIEQMEKPIVIEQPAEVIELD